jgi:O-antigen/teichoic acid export membrane protein
MAAIGATGLALMHLDKILLSRLLPLATFGHYMLAGMVAGGLYAVVAPIFNWTYPRLSQMAAAAPGSLPAQYRLLSHAMACLFLPLGMGVAVGSEGLLALWLGDQALAASLAPVLALLLAGSALHCVMFLPYAMTLARGRADIALRINLVLLAALVPLLLVLSIRYGALGAALAWLLLHVCYMLAGSWFTHRALLPQATAPWLREDVLPVLLLSVALGAAGHALVLGPWAGAPPGLKLMWGLLLCVLGWTIAIFGSARLRRAVRTLFVESTA